MHWCLTAWLGNTPRDCRHRQRKTDELWNCHVHPRTRCSCFSCYAFMMKNNPCLQWSNHIFWECRIALSQSRSCKSTIFLKGILKYCLTFHTMCLCYCVVNVILNGNKGRHHISALVSTYETLIPMQEGIFGIMWYQNVHLG